MLSVRTTQVKSDRHAVLDRAENRVWTDRLLYKAAQQVLRTHRDRHHWNGQRHMPAYDRCRTIAADSEDGPQIARFAAVRRRARQLLYLGRQTHMITGVGKYMADCFRLISTRSRSCPRVETNENSASRGVGLHGRQRRQKCRLRFRFACQSLVLAKSMT